MRAEQSCSSSNSHGTVWSFANQRGQQRCCANSPMGLLGCWWRLNKAWKHYVSISLSDTPLSTSQMPCSTALVNGTSARDFVLVSVSVSLQLLNCYAISILVVVKLSLSDLIILLDLFHSHCVVSDMLIQMSFLTFSPLRRGDKKVVEAEMGWENTADDRL